MNKKYDVFYIAKIECASSLNDTMSYPKLLVAIRSGDSARALAMIDRGVEIPENRRYCVISDDALTLALERQMHDVAAALMARNCKMSNDSLHAAIVAESCVRVRARGDIGKFSAIAIEIIERGCVGTAEELRVAIMFGVSDVAEAMVVHGCAFDSRDLIDAIDKEFTGVALALIARGCDVPWRAMRSVAGLVLPSETGQPTDKVPQPQMKVLTAILTTPGIVIQPIPRVAIESLLGSVPGIKRLYARVPQDHPFAHVVKPKV